MSVRVAMKIDSVETATDGKSEKITLSAVADQPRTAADGSAELTLNNTTLFGTFDEGQLVDLTISESVPAVLRTVEAAPGTPGFDEKVTKGLITHAEAHGENESGIPLAQVPTAWNGSERRVSNRRQGGEDFRPAGSPDRRSGKERRGGF